MPETRDQAPVNNPDPPAGPENGLARIARAVDAFRAGRFVRIVGTGGGEAITALAVETAGPPALRQAGSGSPLLVLSHARARTLKLRLYTEEVVALRPTLPLDGAMLRAIADPTADLAFPLKGPFETVRGNLPISFIAAVRLAKLSGLLPAVLAVSPRLGGEDTMEIPAEWIRDYDQLAAHELTLVTRARVPLEGAERAELAAFRAGNGEPEHYAILIGDPPTDRPALVRLHSECFTGDLLGSLRCDCGAQLRGAIAAIAQAGGGVLLYLAQEGRGIGLVNKLRAYRLQDEGFDTLEANERLGFARDERLYDIAARMLTLLGLKTVRLMTNNPQKVEALNAAGISVVERVPHAFPANAHNRNYLRTKAEKAGHFL
ncbi:MAG TPA: GTP cyclohydrolase II [Rhizomicrobium sp.]|jgi:GTP cyclohydrolase II|nr:GTP cyclohydrolase II [Rhizomicrobium sp.]